MVGKAMTPAEFATAYCGSVGARAARLAKLDPDDAKQEAWICLHAMASASRWIPEFTRTTIDYAVRHVAGKLSSQRSETPNGFVARRKAIRYAERHGWDGLHPAQDTTIRAAKAIDSLDHYTPGHSQWHCVAHSGRMSRRLDESMTSPSWEDRIVARELLEAGERHATKKMSERNMAILAARAGGARLVEIADEHGLSRERVRQICIMASRLMRDEMERVATPNTV